MQWKEHGRASWNPVTFLKALHNARISLTRYQRFFDELGHPKALPGCEVVRYDSLLLESLFIYLFYLFILFNFILFYFLFLFLFCFHRLAYLFYL
jgi:hypothetical protein